MLSQIGRRLGGMSTRRTVAGNVVSPNNNNAAADDASTAAAADESVVDPPAAGDDDLNVDPAAADEPAADADVDELAADPAAANDDELDADPAEADDDELNDDPAAADPAAADAAAAAAAAAAVRNLFDAHVPDFEHNCVFTLEPPMDPVTFDIPNQVYERQALMEFIARATTASIVHPITRRRYHRNFVHSVITPVTDERLSLIRAERVRLGLPLAPIAAGQDEFASDGEESSGDELLRVEVVEPPRQRRRLNNVPVHNEEIVMERGRRAASVADLRMVMGVFLQDGQMRTARHNVAWMSFIQTAGNHEEGIVGALGRGRRGPFFNAQTTALFSATGPFARFRPVRPDALQAKVGQVITAARGIYNQGHSNGDGADFEDIPEWARIIFPLFDGNSLRDAARRDHQAIVRAVGGAQAPLGRVQGNNDAPVQLRNERSRNDGDAELRQRVVGNVDIQREQVEGRGDQANRRIARPAGNRQGQGNHRNRNRVRLHNLDKNANLWMQICGHKFEPQKRKLWFWRGHPSGRDEWKVCCEKLKQEERSTPMRLRSPLLASLNASAK
eukprot:CAMPEP_0113419074 /NCGR_PEP_ID=MMETSP0013_2-20120614/26567_1 /TAXON_ID=2843 ORGANISM="Skeletonema costatum, Strain 1716" /NCGR_SAMPLE_ID=MMETSP0013_2 /ASSEMBLY_ACC=CAM_ASM_000158 /LENGTH=560 /DNA_ID=CAMNT_0000306395 /DNA_START=224 /DNA_END=1906 /DNA_ORIENTATION=+ /assembly_acc=CAM_ASM_000158